MKILLKHLLFLVALFFNISLLSIQAQSVYEHPSNENIYFLLDELANQNIIDLNSTIKPYSRRFIAESLHLALSKKDLLNKRQFHEIEFYLKDYNKEIKQDKDFNKRFDLFYYKDSNFTFSVNPILGARYYSSGGNSVYKRWNGAKAFAYLGKNFGFYANLRDNYESEPLATNTFLNKQTGATFKESEIEEGLKNDVEYSQMRGGITYNWKWGTIGLVKDHFIWGDNYNGSNIFSGKAPSFAHIKLNVKPVEWFEFNYVHGWLVSQVVDSNRSFMSHSTYRKVYYDKYMAANFLTFTPWQAVSFSVGNSIIYSDDQVHPAYFIPVLFYKSVDQMHNGGDHTAGQNSQMFGNISFRKIKYLHLYTSVFVDEINIGNMWDKEKHTNWFSLKGGARLSNLIPNTTLTAEYTRTNPIYKNYIKTTTYESNSYYLGHYLRQNAEEIFFGIRVKPYKRLHLDVSFSKAKKGKEYTYENVEQIAGLSFMDTVMWEKQAISASATYELINDGHIFFRVLSSQTEGNVEQYSPPFFHGDKNTVIFGVNYGF